MRAPKSSSVGLAGISWILAVLASAQAQPFIGTAMVRHAPTLNGSVQGSIRQMTAESATLNGGAGVSGDLLVPGTPTVRLNGSPGYGGTQDGIGGATPTSHTITLNGGASLRHVVRRTDPIALPVVVAPPPPAGTRSVSLNNSSQTPGDFATLRNLTLNSNVGQVTVPPGTYGNFIANSGSGFVLGAAGTTTPAVYNLQNLTLNSNSTFAVVGPVVVTLNGGFSTNSNMGASAHPEWLRLRIAGGGLSLNGKVAVYAHLEAPDGTLTLNGGTTLMGTVAADRLIVNGSAVLQLVANQPPAVVLTSPANGASLPAPAGFTLLATATDGDGTVTKVEFYQGTVRLGEDTTAPYGFPVSGLGAGSYTYTARAQDNLGATADSAPVVLTVMASQPPVVTPVSSALTVSSTTPVSLSFNVSGPAAAITKVEVHRTGQLVATLTSPGSGSTWSFTEPTGLAPGSYQYTATAYNANGSSATSSVVSVTVLPVLPYAADFEPEEGYRTGPLPGQQGWAVEQGSANVTTLDSGHGAQSVQLGAGTPPAVLAQVFAPGSGEPVQFVDFLARPVAQNAQVPAATFTVEGARFAFLQSGGVGRLQVFRGDGAGGGAWASTDFTAPLNAQNRTTDWVRLTARLDFVRRAWDLYGDARLVAADAPFLNNGSTTLTSFQLQGDPATATGLDDIIIGPANPIFADVNNNGIDDAWETAHGLSLNTYNRDLSPAGNGVTVIQAYLTGTDPNDYYNGASPQLAIASGDNQTAPAGQFNARPLVVSVSSLSGPPLANAPVRFNVASGGGQLALSAAGTPALADTLSLRTDANGNAQVHYQQPPAAGVQSTISVQAGLALVTSTTTSTAPADGDGNGLPDDWETRSFGRTGIDPGADPDGDGLSNLQEYQAGSDPNDFFNGVTPQVRTLNDGGPGPADDLAMLVLKPDGAPWPNAPAAFQITAGGRYISATQGGPDYTAAVQVRTDAQGMARVYLEPLDQ